MHTSGEMSVSPRSSGLSLNASVAGNASSAGKLGKKQSYMTILSDDVTTSFSPPKKSVCVYQY